MCFSFIVFCLEGTHFLFFPFPLFSFLFLKKKHFLLKDLIFSYIFFFLHTPKGGANPKGEEGQPPPEGEERGRSTLLVFSCQFVVFLETTN